MKFHKLNSGNAVQQIIDAITQAILHDELKPGDQIPTAQELSESFNVSRNTVQEAIRVLVYTGLLEIRRPVGTFVCEGFSQPMLNPILYGVILTHGNSYDELMDVRENIEASTMLTVIRNALDEEIAALQEPLEALRKACLKKKPVLEEVFRCDDAFHEAIMALGHNQIMEQLAASVRDMTYSMRMESVRLVLESDQGEELYKAHETLYRILRDRDVNGVYSQIRDTYFVPNGNGGVVVLSEKDKAEA